MKKITKIALTGGPCAGKTTCLCQVRDWLISHSDAAIFVVPEAATLVFNGTGRSDNRAIVEHVGHKRQLAIMKTQLSLEDIFADASETETIIICDRGALDIKAYCTNDEWSAFLHDLNLTESRLIERYDGVIHMVTAAIGAVEHYRLEGQRVESAESAACQDEDIRNAYLGHGHQRIVDNSTDFDSKIKRVIAEVARLIGIPEPLEIERKFKVRSTNGVLFGRKSSIRQTYLRSSNGIEERVRSRDYGDGICYTHTTKQRLRSGVREERERPINGQEYLKLLERRDMALRTIEKVRSCFIWGDKVYEHDRYTGNLDGLEIVEVEVSNLDDEIEFPGWITDVVEVTDDPRYSNSSLACHGIPSND